MGRQTVILGILCLVGGAGVGWPRQALSEQALSKVGADVLLALQEEPRARVVIALTSPAEPERVGLESLQAEVAAAQDEVLDAMAARDFRLVLRYRAVPALVAEASADAVARLAAHPGVRRIDLDVGGTGSLDVSVPLIDADEWHARGVTGAGVVVAVLDTGVDTDHSDIQDDLVGQACFLDNDGTINGMGLCPNGSDRQTGAGSAESGLGHGVMTSGIVTSGGVVSSVGVAPDAGILAIKVLDNTAPAGVFYFFSEIVAALDFIITSRPDVRVINMSLGTNALFTGDCDNSTAFNMAGAAAVNTLRTNGVTTFASSGNNSSSTQMTSPACLFRVISVGATDDADNLAGFTNRNASLDILAPGVNITAPGLANGTATGSGTSFASPHAAGCAALFIEAGVATTPVQIETRLKSTGVLVNDPASGLRFPRIDCFHVYEIPTLSPAGLAAIAALLLLAGFVVLRRRRGRWEREGKA